MSLSRLPQVALRRLMPAITAVPKSLDDDQLKKILEPQQQAPTAKHTLPSKSDLSTMSSTQGLVSMLTKLGNTSSAGGAEKATPALGRLLLNLSGNQGVLSSQELALLKLANQEARGGRGDSLASTPEPASPRMDRLLLLPADGEPQAGALDPASVDALTSALRETTTDCGGDASLGQPHPCDQQLLAGSRKQKQKGRAAETLGSPVSALLEHNELAAELDDQTDDEMPPISSELSAAERRREQNRRAQKKFRQKDKVRQKEVKWRAAQYDSLVESNKRFKKDIDSVTRERDMYRRILELNGINIDEETRICRTGSATLESLRDCVADNNRALSMASSVTVSNSPAMSPVAASLSASALMAPSMDQIVQDTFGSIPTLSLAAEQQSQQQQQQQQQPVSMQDLISSLLFGGGVKQDPMFGGSASQSPSSPLPSISPSATAAETPSQQSLWFDAGAGSPAAMASAVSAVSGGSADPLLVESPLIIDQSQMDAQFGDQQHQTMIDSHMVDPMAFIDELLASPGFAAQSPAVSYVRPAGLAAGSIAVATESRRTRKRSFDDIL